MTESGGKVPTKSADLIEDRVRTLKKLFPEVFTEDRLDFRKLSETLGRIEVPEGERYSFTWSGRSGAIKIRDKRSNGTLKPFRTESVDFEKTDNIFVEGESLEVLKILQKSYNGEVSVIYIDPPYNVDADVEYPDDLKEPLRSYLRYTGQVTETGKRLTTDVEKSGRYHSRWLSKMYPRLYLARNLLKTEGVLFVSIDDFEVQNLKNLLNEIFGEENFVDSFIIRSNPRGKQAKKLTASEHEYVLCYAKDRESINPLGFVKDETDYNRTDSAGRRYRELGLRKRGAGSRREDAENEYFPIYYNPDTGEITTENRKDGFMEIIPRLSVGSDGRWRWSRKTVEEKKNSLTVRGVRRNGSLEYDVFEIDYFSEDKISKVKSIFSEKEVNYENATEELKELFGGKKVFDYPKPVHLVKKLINSVSDFKEGIVLDFFAGSGTTAQAVMELNLEDGGRRKFIVIQFPEPTSKDLDAFKEGFHTIAEVSKERIRRAIKKIKGDITYDQSDGSGQDLGFRVFKLSESNMFVWDPEEVDSNESLERYVEQSASGASKSDREALIFELMLREGLSLNSEIEEVRNKGTGFFRVSDGEYSFWVSFDETLRAESIEGMGLTKDDKLIVFDSSLTDTDKANISRKLRVETI